MSVELSSILVCPVCASQLAAETGALICAAGHRFPIKNGIPRLAPIHLDPEARRTGATFGFQWNQFDVINAHEDEQVFRAKTGLAEQHLRGKLVLDAGCGGGRYVRVAALAGASVIGVDLSNAVEHARAATADLPNVAVLQSDLFALPFRSATFDVVYSLGVLHHTPSTQRAFMSIARLVKPGGILAVWLYRRNTWWQEALNSALRRGTVRLPIPVLVALSRVGATLGGVPVLKHLNKIVNFSSHPRWETRICDTFDWFAPPHQFHHTEEELVSWFAAAGFQDIQTLYSQPSNATLYRWAYARNLIIGSGVNVVGRRSIGTE